MKQIISVRFKENGKSYSFDPAGLDIHTGDYVIVVNADKMVLSREGTVLTFRKY